MGHEYINLINENYIKSCFQATNYVPKQYNHNLFDLE